jgi:rhamnose utilization protein RhaD (predicted bifunctional aldolase and dehydrogenase)
MSTDPLADLVALSRWLGDPERALAILGEGNTSAVVAPGRIRVKASGASLGASGPEDFVEIDVARALSLLEKPSLSDAELAAGLAAARTDGDRRPSIEAILHALAVDTAGASFVGHTHPVALNELLCSDQADALVAGALFPDQIVVCGRHPVLVPYADPGLPLARAVRDGLSAHLQRHGVPPRVVYLRNHGMLALGQSAVDVRQITEMTVKAARVLASALAVGAPRYLTDEQADRIDSREDEHHRQQILARQR